MHIILTPPRNEIIAYPSHCTALIVRFFSHEQGFSYTSSFAMQAYIFSGFMCCFLVTVRTPHGGFWNTKVPGAMLELAEPLQHGFLKSSEGTTLSERYCAVPRTIAPSLETMKNLWSGFRPQCPPLPSRSMPSFSPSAKVFGKWRRRSGVVIVRPAISFDDCSSSRWYAVVLMPFVLELC